MGKLNSFGILPGQIISELYDEGRIKTEHGRYPSIEPGMMELSVSGNSKPEIIMPGEKANFRVGEILDLPENIYPVTDAKSSVAKTDTEIIVRGLGGYRLEKGYSGELQIEVRPYKFSVMVMPGKPLSNMRLYNCIPSHAIMDPEILVGKCDIILANMGKSPNLAGNNIMLHVDLIGDNSGIVGYKALETGDVIILDKGRNFIGDFFEPIHACSEYDMKRSDFVLLSTKENTYVNPSLKEAFAANMPRRNLKGEKVNRAEFLNYGSGPHKTVMEIHADYDMALHDGCTMCEITLHRFAQRPQKTYITDGNQNNKTMTGTFFYGQCV